MSDVEFMKSILWAIVSAAQISPRKTQDWLLQKAAENLCRYIELRISEKTGKPYEIPSGVK